MILKGEYERGMIGILNTELHNSIHGLLKENFGSKCESMLNHGPLGTVLT